MAVLPLAPLPAKARKKIRKQGRHAANRMTAAGVTPAVQLLRSDRASARRPEVEAAQLARCQATGREFVPVAEWDHPRAELWMLWLYRDGAATLGAWNLAVPRHRSYRVAAGMVVPGLGEQVRAARYLDARMIHSRRHAPMLLWHRWTRIDWGPDTPYDHTALIEKA